MYWVHDGWVFVEPSVVYKKIHKKITTIDSMITWYHLVKILMTDSTEMFHICVILSTVIWWFSSTSFQTSISWLGKWRPDDLQRGAVVSISFHKSITNIPLFSQEVLTSLQIFSDSRIRWILLHRLKQSCWILINHSSCTMKFENHTVFR